jgi:hypothetical protein
MLATLAAIPHDFEGFEAHISDPHGQRHVSELLYAVL